MVTLLFGDVCCIDVWNFAVFFCFFVLQTCFPAMWIMNWEHCIKRSTAESEIKINKFKT